MFWIHQYALYLRKHIYIKVTLSFGSVGPQVHGSPNPIDRHMADSYLCGQLRCASMGCILWLLQGTGNDLLDLLVAQPWRPTRRLDILKPNDPIPNLTQC